VELTEALLDAFPTRRDLDWMLRFRLNKRLDEITGPGNLRDAAYQLVRAAEALGFMPELFAAALAEVPGNPRLRAIAERRR
jgi:hypothetical protein